MAGRNGVKCWFAKKILKKLIAISLLFLHLFSTERQLVRYEYLAYQSDKLYDEQIDQNHYNIHDLTEIRIPVNLPNTSGWGEYINLRGCVKFGNTAYNYVKIKITKGAIYLVCIPNYSTTHLWNRNVIDARQIPDIPVPKKDHVPACKISLTNFSHQTISYRFSTPLAAVSKPTIFSQLYLPDMFVGGLDEPPEISALFS
jgi:hypothetical protein